MKLLKVSRLVEELESTEQLAIRQVTTYTTECTWQIQMKKIIKTFV